MNSALHVMLTTRRGIIVFIAQVMTLDATAAYPNHMGHSVCLRNSMLSPNIAQNSCAQFYSSVWSTSIAETLRTRLATLAGLSGDIMLATSLLVDPTERRKCRTRSWLSGPKSPRGASIPENSIEQRDPDCLRGTR